MNSFIHAVDGVSIVFAFSNSIFSSSRQPQSNVLVDIGLVIYTKPIKYNMLYICIALFLLFYY